MANCTHWQPEARNLVWDRDVTGKECSRADLLGDLLKRGHSEAESERQLVTVKPEFRKSIALASASDTLNVEADRSCILLGQSLGP